MTWSRSRHSLGESCTAVHLGRGVLLFASVVLALVCGASTARAGGSPIPTPHLMATGPVHAGDLIEIRWDSLPPDVDEMELILSVDGGRHYPIRISAEISGRENSFLWRVPNLGVREARLRLRAHHHWREVESGPGNEFAILSDPTKPAELDQVHEGGWWEGIEPIDVDASGLAGPRPSFHNHAGGTDGEAPHRVRLQPAPVDRIAPAPMWSAARAEAASAHAPHAAPLFRPRRE